MIQQNFLSSIVRRTRAIIKALMIAALLAGLIPQPLIHDVATQIEGLTGVQDLSELENVLPQPAVALAQAPITGTVYRDFNADGQLTTSGPVQDMGLGGVTITAYDATGATCGSAQSDPANGTYSLTPTCAGPDFRLEFTTLPANYEPSAFGSGNGTSVQFASAGDSNVNFAVNRPIDYAQADPAVAMSTYIYGDATSAQRAITRINWDASGAPTQIAPQNLIGSTWGLAYKRDTAQLFASAVVKRHSGLGSQGLGGVYVVTNPAAASPAVASFVDLDAAPFNINFGDLPDNGTRGLGNDPNVSYADVLAFPAAATQGIGDIDLSDDGNTLWIVNLFAETGGMGSLIKLDVTDGVAPTSADAFPLANMSGLPTCTGGVLRPWALTIEAGVGYLGAVCSAETSLDRNDLAAYVFSFDPDNPTALTTVLAIDPLTYTKGASHNGNEGAPGFSNLWHPWRSVLTTPAPNGQPWGTAPEENESPSPVLADIEFDEHGSMILGFLDRRGMQWGGSTFVQMIL